MHSGVYACVVKSECDSRLRLLRVSDAGPSLSLLCAFCS